MPSDALMQTIETAIELVRQFGDSCVQREHPNRRYSPTERLRGREAESRQRRAALDQAAAAIGDLREPIADALERASMDSTPWLRFIAHVAQGKRTISAEPVLELLQRLQRRARLGLIRQ